MSDHVYIFLDEAGNLDFTATGSRYFVLTSISIKRPFSWFGALDDLKYDCLEVGLKNDVFHCSEDNRHVRNRVFDIIAKNLSGLEIDSLIVDKRKIGPALRAPNRFYPEMLGYLLKFVVPRQLRSDSDEVTVITDNLPLSSKRKTIEKSIKLALTKTMPPMYRRYRVLHHNSRAHYGLQVADYCCWAVFRKREREDSTYFSKIEPAINSEFDIFRDGMIYYY